MSGIVISYRRDDTEGSAGRLYDRLVTRYGQDFVFVDLNSIEPAEDWLKTIDETIRSSNVVIALIGPRWLSATDDSGRRRLDDEGDYVRREIRTAIDHSIRLLPVLVQGAFMVGGRSLPADIRPLSEVQPAHLDSRYYDRDIEELYRVVDEILGFGGEIPRWDRECTAIAGFVGLAERGSPDEPTLITDWPQFKYNFGEYQPGCYLAHAVSGWFANGGGECWVVRVGDDDGGNVSVDAVVTGIHSLQSIEPVTILAAPDIVGLHERGLIDQHGVLTGQLALINQCERSWNRLAILDPLPMASVFHVAEFLQSFARWDSAVAAFYYPWVRVLDPISGMPTSVPPSGHVAGSWARNDHVRAIWNAPANQPLAGVVDLSEKPSRDDLMLLQRSRINVIRPTHNGIMVWGARTLTQSSRYTDIATVRLIIALGRFIVRVTSWAAFEPSNVRTWHRLRTNVEIVLESLWEKGAFAAESAGDAFYVICDGDLNYPDLAAAGKVRVEFGFLHASTVGFIRMRVEQPSGEIQLFAD
jgi:hypothetical protein